MDLSIPHEMEMLRSTVRGFVRDYLAPLEEEVDESDEVDPAVMRRLREKALKLGLYGYNMPVELGGPGLSMLAQVLIGEEIGHTSMPLGESLGHLPGTLTFCDPAQKEWFVAPLMKAETTVAYALTEPDAGSDVGALKTTAVKVDGGWHLNGTKHFISKAEDANHIIVLAANDRDASLRQRLTTFIVERDNPGLKMIRRFRKMGWRGYPLSAFSLEDCFVPEDHVLGKTGDGFRSIMATINNDRLFVGARCVGIAQALRDLAVPYARDRVTFGRPLADHEAIQFYLADIDTELEAARMLVYKAAFLADSNDGEFRIAASRAKLFASEMAGRAADRVLQIFGGAGYMCDLPVERFYRDVRAFRLGEGTSEMQRIQIARHLLA